MNAWLPTRTKGWGCNELFQFVVGEGKALASQSVNVVGEASEVDSLQESEYADRGGTPSGHGVRVLGSKAKTQKELETYLRVSVFVQQPQGESVELKALIDTGAEVCLITKGI